MSWKTLKETAEKAASLPILDRFSDPHRASNFSITAGDLLFDYSKTSLDEAGRSLLVAMFEELGVPDRREAMLTGSKINETEGRAVLHTALRKLSGGSVNVDGVDVMPEVLATLDRMEKFSEALREGEIQSPSGQPFSDVVNIGIGGSDLGPAMATLALAPFHDGPRVHYVSNVDGAHINDVLIGLNPRTTLVIVASKTFSTIETMTNATTARKWISEAVSEQDIGQHFAALSTAEEKTAEFGIPADRVFGFEDWVGGRYSLWGPIGLGIMIAIGPKAFRAFLAGGEAMDRHFHFARPLENIPVMLALVGIWHNQGLGYATRAVLPYEQRLSRLPAYLQQLEMESNGKGVSMDAARGLRLNVQCGR